jgi:hypothetical protein
MLREKLVTSQIFSNVTGDQDTVNFQPLVNCYVKMQINKQLWQKIVTDNYMQTYLVTKAL